jgi:magnesium transporter
VPDPGINPPIASLRELLEHGTADELHAFLTRFHPSDLADLLEELEDDERRLVLLALAPAPALAAEALAEMEWEEHPEESLAALEPDQIASLVGQLSDDDAADIIGELDPEDRDRVLAALPLLDAGDIRDLLRYDDESAGGLMTTELVAVEERLTAAEAIEEVRRQGREVGEFYSIFVIDSERRLRGTLPLRSLVTAAPSQPIWELVEPVVATVEAHTDQEEVGRVLSRYNLVAVPVLDTNGRLLGRVTFDDVIDVFEAETTEDILKFAGASEEEEIRGDWADAVRSRLPWLFVNLFTASASAAVVFLFQDTIERLTLLAALMPVIAGMGGNTGTQALAVTVRRLALSRESASRRWGVVGKELLVGMSNGLAIGILAAAAALGLAVALGETRMLGVVVLLAMWLNLMVAGFAGAFVPILLERLGADPAVASSIFVTAFTDMVGFLLLLGLATQLLM